MYSYNNKTLFRFLVAHQYRFVNMTSCRRACGVPMYGIQYWIRRFALVLLVINMLPGCAAIMSDDFQPVELETIPAHAECILDGKNYRKTVTTPTTVILPRDAIPIRVTCESIGHATESRSMETSLNPWVFGNVILGGVIGLAIDIGTDSTQDLPSRVLVRLSPMPANSRRSQRPPPTQVMPRGRENAKVRNTGKSLSHLNARDKKQYRFKHADMTKFWTETIELVSEQCLMVGDGSICPSAIASAKTRRDNAILELNEKYAVR